MSENDPQRRETLKILVTYGAVTWAESLSSLALIPSRPVALLVLNLLSSCNTHVSISLKLKEWGEVTVVTVNLVLIESLILFASVDPMDEK